jgi:predicted NAD-dependent protein-ADP-ribosyltransferase YbiA (DUF1768 family)
MFREYQNNEEVIQFYSCGKAPYYKLSNFALINEGILFDGLTFCSTEHAFQAQKYIKEQRFRFSINGDLGNVNNLNSSFEFVFGNNWEKKKKFWMKKNNIGIIAKMATNIKIGKRLGLIRDINFISTDELWMELLTLKYNINEFKIILQSIGNKYLLEFDRGAKRMCLKNVIPIWSAIIEDGIIYGNNLMGKYLMLIKEKIIH